MLFRPSVTKSGSGRTQGGRKKRQPQGNFKDSTDRKQLTTILQNRTANWKAPLLRVGQPTVSATQLSDKNQKSTMGLLGDYNRTHINTCVFCICTPIQVYCSSCIRLYFHAIPYDKRLSCSYHHTVTQHPRSTLLANELLTELCLTAHKAQDAKAGL